MSTRVEPEAQDIVSQAEALGYRVQQYNPDPFGPWYIMTRGCTPFTPFTGQEKFEFGPFPSKEEATTQGLPEILAAHVRAEQLKENYHIRYFGRPRGVHVWAVCGHDYRSPQFDSPSAALDEAERLAQQLREDRERFAAMDRARRVERCRIPEALAGISLDSFTAKTDALKNALEKSREYVRTFMPDKSYHRSLWFCGEAGIGKTTLACAVASAVAIAGHHARYATVTDIINADRDDGVLNELRAPDLLVLDWFGIQPASNKKRDRDQAALLCALSGHWIGAVLEARYADNRQTLLIADCDLETLKRGLGRERLFYVQIIGF